MRVGETICFKWTASRYPTVSAVRGCRHISPPPRRTRTLKWGKWALPHWWGRRIKRACTPCGSPTLLLGIVGAPVSALSSLADVTGVLTYLISVHSWYWAHSTVSSSTGSRSEASDDSSVSDSSASTEHSASSRRRMEDARAGGETTSSRSRSKRHLSRHAWNHSTPRTVHSSHGPRPRDPFPPPSTPRGSVSSVPDATVLPNGDGALSSSAARYQRPSRTSGTLQLPVRGDLIHGGESDSHSQRSSYYSEPNDDDDEVSDLDDPIVAEPVVATSHHHHQRTRLGRRLSLRGRMGGSGSGDAAVEITV
eukprot:m.618743 g.618743  ORF g.618743 m.618743 type:complete len:308 (+) comp22529_c2_seq9:1794-2717(+)